MTPSTNEREDERAGGTGMAVVEGEAHSCTWAANDSQQFNMSRMDNAQSTNHWRAEDRIRQRTTSRLYWAYVLLRGKRSERLAQFAVYTMITYRSFALRRLPPQQHSRWDLTAATTATALGGRSLKIHNHLPEAFFVCRVGPGRSLLRQLQCLQRQTTMYAVSCLDIIQTSSQANTCHGHGRASQACHG